jgi:hypothetical protein
MADKTPEEIATEQALTASQEQSAVAEELESFGKRLREIATGRMKAIKTTVSSSLKKQIKNIAQKPKDIARAAYGALPPVLQSVVSGVGELGSDIVGAFRGDSRSERTPVATGRQESMDSDRSNGGVGGNRSLEEIAKNTEETSNILKNLVNFFKGNQLEEYEREREEEIRNEKLLNAIRGDGVESEDGEKSSSKFLAPIKKVFLAIKGLFSAALIKPLLIVGGVIAGIFGFVKLIGNDNVKKIFDTIKNIRIETILQSIVDIKDSIIEFFSSIWNTTKETFQNAVENVLSVFNMIKNTITEKISEIVEFFSNIIGVVTNFFSSIPEKIRETIGGKIEQIVNFFSESIETITGFFSSIGEKLTGLLPNWAKRLLGIQDEPSDSNVLGSNTTETNLSTNDGTTVPVDQMSPVMKLKSIQSGVIEPSELTTPVLNELLTTIFPSSAENIMYEPAKQSIMMELQNRSYSGPALSVGELSAFGLQSDPRIEPIRESSQLLNATNQSEMLRDMGTSQGSGSNITTSQVNISQDSYSSIMTPQYSPNARPETAQDIYGQPAY